jgi:hypothetical protein
VGANPVPLRQFPTFNEILTGLCETRKAGWVARLEHDCGIIVMKRADEHWGIAVPPAWALMFHFGAVIGSAVPPDPGAFGISEELLDFVDALTENDPVWAQRTYPNDKEAPAPFLEARVRLLEACGLNAFAS